MNLSFAALFASALAAAPVAARPAPRAATPKTAQVQLPATTPGRLLSTWLGLCDAAAIQALTAWGAKSYSPRVLERQSAAQLARGDARDCAVDGGYRPLAILTSEARLLEVAVLARKTTATLKLRIRLDAQDRIEGLLLAPLAPAEASLPRPLTDDSVRAVLSAYLQKLDAAGEFSGTVVVARAGKPVITLSTGFSNRATRAGFGESTQFTLGSMGKLFTTVAIGQLVDAGKVAYTDPVGKFFPSYANETVREKVTVGMLLSHTAGLGDFLEKRTPAMMKEGIRRASELVPLFEKDELRFAPGTSWAYSNAGLALAGAIVEQVSGEDYPAYLRKHIFEPAGMKDSDVNNVPHRDPRLVIPYTRGDNGEWEEAPADLGSPAGGAISTALDLVRFAEALRNGTLVKSATFALIAAPHATAPRGEHYGYGMSIEELYGRTLVGHGGGFPGVSTQLSLVQGTDLTVVVLANQDPPAASRVSTRANALVVAQANAAGARSAGKD